MDREEEETKIERNEDVDEEKNNNLRSGRGVFCYAAREGKKTTI